MYSNRDRDGSGQAVVVDHEQAVTATEGRKRSAGVVAEPEHHIVGNDGQPCIAVAIGAAFEAEVTLQGCAEHGQALTQPGRRENRPNIRATRHRLVAGHGEVDVGYIGAAGIEGNCDAASHGNVGDRYRDLCNEGASKLVGAAVALDQDCTVAELGGGHDVGGAVAQA